MKIAAAQLCTLPITCSRLDHYLAMSKRYDVKLVVFGEYVLNSFFTELLTMPKSMIKEQSNAKKTALIELSKKYDLELIAPLVMVGKQGLKKVCLRVNKTGIKSYEQQALINYPHWNEEKFFQNTPKPFKLFSFTLDGLKIAVMFGFEAHFNVFWDQIMSKKIDLVLLPCANTFASYKRWEAMLCTRAFCSNVSILRVNRIGNTGPDWDFYGKSMLIDANGDIIDALQGEEGLLVINASKSTKERKFWGFERYAKRLRQA